MKVHLVSGFLGSGKTTAIILAAKYFIRQGKKLGVITNDQGKYLVDTAFVRLNDIPAVEVNGSCFCCNYRAFNDSLDKLTSTLKPDLIFAESVGTCADIVATVAKPLLDYKATQPADTSLTTFCDCRLLNAYLKGEELPFQENVIYIFEQQIVEAGMLVIHKIDLISDDKLKETQKLLAEKYPQKDILAMSSLDGQGVSLWLDRLEKPQPGRLDSVDIDYDTYGSGEQLLAWYDARVRISGKDGSAVSGMQCLINQIRTRVKNFSLPVGHIKFLLNDGSRFEKFSLLTGAGNEQAEKFLQGSWKDRLDLIINARVQSTSIVLQDLFWEAIQECADEQTRWKILDEDAFHPGYPAPKFRIV